MDSILSFVRSHPYFATGGFALAAYMALVRHLRYQRIRRLQRKYPDPTLPLRNYEVAREVAASIIELDFPYITVVALEFALFKTYAIPTISKILASTKQFTGKCLKRVDDTTLILLEMTETFSRNKRRELIEGKTDPKEVENDTHRSHVATERLNFIHGHYNIKQDDYLYTLSLFVSDPNEFIGRFEWRPLTRLEQNSLLALWTHQGKAMGIQNIPETLEEFARWSEDYEREHAVYAPSNAEVAQSTISLLLSLYPKFTHSLGRLAVSSLLTDRMRTAFDITPAPTIVLPIVTALLRARALFIRYFMLPRRLPLVRTALRANADKKFVPNFNKYEPVYPNGYRVEDLGPEKFLGKCPVSFHPSGVVPSHGAETQ